MLCSFHVSRTPNILILDDEPGVRQLFESILTADGYEVTSVGTYQHALRLLKYQQFEIAILDLSVRDYDGFELIKQIRAAHPSLNILSMGSYVTGTVPAMAKAAGATAVIEKPVAPGALRKMVLSLLHPDSDPARD